MDLVRFAWAHARGDWRRSGAAAFAITVAVMSLVVLTGTISREHLTVTTTLDSNYRSTYDILVRPAGSATDAEKTLGAVRPNFLTGTYGGITSAQLDAIRAVNGVQVAAPVAVLGQITRTQLIAVNVAKVLGDRQRAMVRYRFVGAARNGTGEAPISQGYLYITREELTTPDGPNDEQTSLRAEMRQQIAGKQVKVCLAASTADQAATPNKQFDENCYSMKDGDAPTVEALLEIPLAVQAIDPVAEEQLTGLSSAIVSGRMLTTKDAITEPKSDDPRTTTGVPAIMPTTLPFDLKATLTVEEVPEVTIDRVMATDDRRKREAIVTDAQPTRTVNTTTVDAAKVYSSGVARFVAAADQEIPDGGQFFENLMRPGQVTYSGAGPLAPQVVPCDPTQWLIASGERPEDGEAQKTFPEYNPAPFGVCDTGFRSLSLISRTPESLWAFNLIGTFDPAGVEGQTGANALPLETYRSPVVTGADAASSTALGNKPLESDTNPAGYLQAPPAVLVPMTTLPDLAKYYPKLDISAPISSVRVRVSGVTGMTPTDRERIRVIAEQIQQRTGLDVDITIGASLSNQAVALPATESGTPALLVNEQWTKKGVAVAIADAVDTKSAFLLALVLASSALTVWLTASAAVQSRRKDLGTLACLGWRSGLRSRAVAVELALIGLASGAIGTLLAIPTALALGASLVWPVVALGVPVGVLLAVIPGLGATAAAARVAPAELFRPAAGRPGRARRVWGPISMGLALLLRRPGRIIVGTLGIGLAAASGGLLAAVVGHMNTTLIGSFLGDAVAVQIRIPDIAAAVLIGLLGLTALATLLFLGLSEDARSLAALRAVGWTDGMLARSVLAQAFLIGILGALLGAVSAAGVWIYAFGTPDSVAINALVAVAIAAIPACLLAAYVPAWFAGRLPTARILSSD